MKSVNNKHNEFAESLRNIMRTEEKPRPEPKKNSNEDYDEETQSIQELLEAKFDELFGTTDDNDD